MLPRDVFLAYMNKMGLNVTKQRRIIAQAFFEFPGHHSLEEFYKFVAEREPNVGQTTVYRTLKLLCEAGLAREIHFSDGIARYEVNVGGGHHDHIVCESCGKTVEICDERIESLQREIAEQHGFRLTSHVHHLYGLCSACRRAAEEKP
ncbi:MAG: Fur family transcriptional regulator [Desulfovibrionaceae bacterium]